MIVATAIASIGVFVVALSLSGVVGAAVGVMATTQRAMATMRDRSLDDMSREKAIQQVSIRLFSDFASILVRGLIAVVASLLPIWLADLFGLADSGSVYEFLSRWDVILAATAVMVAGYLVRIRTWPTN